MKRFEKVLMLLLMLIEVTLFSACSDEKDEPKIPNEKQRTTYTITVESNAGQLAQQNGLTSKIDFSIIEYNDKNEVVNIQGWYGIPDGISTKKFTANDLATKLVIKYNVYAYKNGKEVASETRYYAIVYYLKLNSDLQINLDGNSNVSKYNPI